MKEKIFNNLSLKIVSAVFAVILWTVIVNIYDPNTSYTFSNITVQRVLLRRIIHLRWLTAVRYQLQ